MADTVADFTLTRLYDWGVRRIFGYPGDGISGLVAAIGRDDTIDFIQTRHEEEAAFMACAHAKWTGEPGVCLATSGPGAIHLLNGLYDAKLDHQPVVALVGQQDQMALGGNYLQEVDLVSLLKDVAGAYLHRCGTPEQARHLIDRALRTAITRRTVTAVIFPDNVQKMDAVKEPPRAHGTVHSGIGAAVVRPAPPEDELARAAEILNSGRKVAILAGAGALGAGPDLRETAEKLGAGVAKALLGKAVLPDDLPYVTGQIGLLGTEPSDWMMRNCDTFLMIGSRFPYAEFLPKEGQARGVQIDIDPTMQSIRYPMEINLFGDAAATLRALLPLLNAKTENHWRRSIERRVESWWRGVERRTELNADPINPELLFAEASARLPDGAIISADSGTSANWFARAIRIREGMKASLSGTLATMCPAVPYATAAKFAYPERVAIGFVGDGAMQMLGLNGLISIAKYWRVWKDPRLVIAVLNNGDLNQVTWELRTLAGSPKVPETQDLPDFSYAAFARSLGLGGIRVERPEDVGPAWDSALGADRPVVIDAVVDPDVPTLPPHITAKQARNYAKALANGDPDASGVLWHSFKRVLS